MKHKNTHNSILFFCIILIITAILSGCGNTTPETGFKMCFDTIISISLYDQHTSDDLLDNTLDLCSEYELIFSRTNPDSELYRLNQSIHSNEQNIPVSDMLFDCIKSGYEYTILSDNALNIALGNVISLWNFRDQQKNIPDYELIKQALSHSDISDLILNDDGTISCNDTELSLDLGALAKGYIGNELREYLIDNGCKNAIISLAGNVICIGDNNNAGYEIGIQKPFGKQGELITSVNVKDTCVVTSGTYERCFEKDGIIYHHILDSKTGFPVESDLTSVTIICDDSLKADILSTTILSMGKEKGTAYLSSFPDVSAILITKDNELIYVNR